MFDRIVRAGPVCCGDVRRRAFAMGRGLANGRAWQWKLPCGATPSSSVRDMRRKDFARVDLAWFARIPALVGVEGATRCIKSGNAIVLDALGRNGLRRPRKEVLVEYERLRSDLDARRDAPSNELVGLPAVTRDRVGVRLLANTGNRSRRSCGRPIGAHEIEQLTRRITRAWDARPIAFG
jgi:hypothetical protein